MFSWLAHLECTSCRKTFDANRLIGLCPGCGKVLYARYDLASVRGEVARDELRTRRPDMWRYHELMPVRHPAHVVSLGEGLTPLLEAPRLAKRYGMKSVLLKDEGKNPTGSFKARGIAAAVSRAKELGVTAASMPTAGNAGSAFAAYAARAGMAAYVVMPKDTPIINQAECVAYGAHAWVIDGLITDAGRVLREAGPSRGWFDLSTLREPYRVEGKKTMGYEIAEALGWTMPDVIVYPAGGGTGLVGIWKAVAEMAELGWIDSRRPRMMLVQAEGCAPIVRAFRQQATHAAPVENAHTVASGLRVPAAIGDYLMLQAVRESGGTALTVTDDQLLQAMRELAATEGVFAGPEAAATLAALKQLRDGGAIRPGEQVLLLLTGAGIKSFDQVPVELPVIDPADPAASFNAPYPRPGASPR